MTQHRLEGFSDAVFAIVITLLILDVRIPPGLEPGWSMLREMAPHVGIFALSFAIVGTYWVAHHMMLRRAGRITRRLLWLNLLLLLAVVFIPVPTALLAEHPDSVFAIVVYAASLSLANLFGTIVWLYATRHPDSYHLERPRRQIAMVHAAPIAVYAIGAAVATVSVPIGLLLLAAVPAFFILPNPLLRRLERDQLR